MRQQLADAEARVASQARLEQMTLDLSETRQKQTEELDAREQRLKAMAELIEDTASRRERELAHLASAGLSHALDVWRLL